MLSRNSWSCIDVAMSPSSARPASVKSPPSPAFLLAVSMCLRKGAGSRTVSAAHAAELFSLEQAHVVASLSRCADPRFWQRSRNFRMPPFADRLLVPGGGETHGLDDLLTRERLGDVLHDPGLQAD